MKENTKLDMRGLREPGVGEGEPLEFERIIQTVLYSTDTSQEKTQTDHLWIPSSRAGVTCATGY